jgi:hypothetical protein
MRIATRLSVHGLLVLSVGLPGVLAGRAYAFDPANGDWHKDGPTQIRVMTWNIQDAIGIGVDTTPATPTTYGSAYDYVGRICHAFDPDILCMQEIEPSSSYGGTITAVTQWAETYFGPGVFNVYVSADSDGFNRNVILSKFPFVDINGDGVAVHSDIASISPSGSGVPPGGDGGIRGWTEAEIDLPDDVFLGDLYMGSSHLKAGSSDCADYEEREDAAQNIAYYINEALNKSQATGGDPENLILLQPPQPLGTFTPVVQVGDHNEIRNSAHTCAGDPVRWIAEWTTAANDGTDRDGSTMHIDDAIQLFTTSSRSTFVGSDKKFDYVIVQDSIATPVREFIYKSTRSSSNLPPDLQGILNGYLASGFASDHLPVLVDLSLPLLAPGDFNRDGHVNLDDLEFIEDCLQGPNNGLLAGCDDEDLDSDADVDLGDFQIFQEHFGS